jgi:hypothetical protein
MTEIGMMISLIYQAPGVKGIEFYRVCLKSVDVKKIYGSTFRNSSAMAKRFGGKVVKINNETLIEFEV